jgi:hypothetical protein
MRTNFLATLLALLCLVLGPAYAADKDVGIVLLHGKWDRQPTNVQGLARRLAAEGFQVTAPIMPWSANREYDVPYPQAISEIEAAAKGLRDKGVKSSSAGSALVQTRRLPMPALGSRSMRYFFSLRVIRPMEAE